MCTVTWRHAGGACEVFFNRDEKRARPPASPPGIHLWSGTRVVAPIDAAAGGTWLAANETGLVVGLLNFYDAAPSAPPAGARSRGWLVREASVLRSPDLVAEWIAARDLRPYPPFLLFWLSREHAARVVAWDGATLAPRPADEPMVTTSSFDTARVIAARRERFRALGGAGGDLEAFHRGAAPEGGAYSVCMTRADAMTVSLSHVRIDASSIRFRYTARDAAGDFAPPVETVMDLA